jgi:hypothetical protein
VGKRKRKRRRRRRADPPFANPAKGRPPDGEEKKAKKNPHLEKHKGAAPRGKKRSRADPPFQSAKG